MDKCRPMLFARIYLAAVVVAALCSGHVLAQQQTRGEAYRAFRDNFGVFEATGYVITTEAEISGVRAHMEHDIQEVFQDARVGMDSYVFRVPNGRYRVQLFFAEIEKTAPGERVFGISMQQQPIVESLDIFAEVGANRAHQVVSDYVEVTEDVIRLSFDAQIGEPLLSAISIGGEIDGAPELVSRVFYAHMNNGGPQYYGFNPDFGQ